MFDGLLDSAPQEVAATVLSCGARLAGAVAPLASRSAAAAGQLEWVLHAVQSLLHQLQPPQQQAGGVHVGQGQQHQHRGPSRSPDQQRALAGQLVLVVHAVYMHDVRLPRLQSQMMVSPCRCSEGSGCYDGSVNLRGWMDVFENNFRLGPGDISLFGTAHSGRRAGLHACASITLCPPAA